MPFAPGLAQVVAEGGQVEEAGPGELVQEVLGQPLRLGLLAAHRQLAEPVDGQDLVNVHGVEVVGVVLGQLKDALHLRQVGLEQARVVESAQGLGLQPGGHEHGVEVLADP